jgi:hypothetical protein
MMTDIAVSYERLARYVAYQRDQIRRRQVAPPRSGGSDEAASRFR